MVIGTCISITKRCSCKAQCHVTTLLSNSNFGTSHWHHYPNSASHYSKNPSKSKPFWAQSLPTPWLVSSKVRDCLPFNSLFLATLYSALWGSKQSQTQIALTNLVLLFDKPLFFPSLTLFFSQFVTHCWIETFSSSGSELADSACSSTTSFVCSLHLISVVAEC